MLRNMKSIFSDMKRMGRCWKRRKLKGSACNASRATTVAIISKYSG